MPLWLTGSRLRFNIQNARKGNRILSDSGDTPGTIILRAFLSGRCNGVPGLFHADLPDLLNPLALLPGGASVAVFGDIDALDRPGWLPWWDSVSDDVSAVTETDHDNGTRRLRLDLALDEPYGFLQLNIHRP
jgi:hypothetical protein